ncbi:hypothetical protein JOC75_000094 [Metabacillus crassostreae]|uniref:DUF2515 family protein n=1 Tax=Metabacillus crassostreae TaxID=929098 RepID=UPI00195E0B32|nr:hypothetical protein [Metabacillus crassostreae]
MKKIRTTKNSKKASQQQTFNQKDKLNLYTKIEESLRKVDPVVITQKEKKLIRNIQHNTQQLNLNNITRTKAYLSYFKDHEEIHWAFLAHMVSRNGGYNMTDLKGSLLDPLLDEEDKMILFHLLEKANALIFHDAFPQLLLYKFSLKEQTSLFHLLPAFNVSKFMIPIWEDFLEHKNSTLLTFALITNEQQYIEKNLMSEKTIKENILHSLTYLIQEKLGFTHVIFPYKRYSFLPKYSLSGLEVHNFNSVVSRIKIGKHLYNILFTKNRYETILEFAIKHHHSGSRSDYWPHIFSNNELEHHKLVSPTLTKAWRNIPHRFHMNQDWFTQLSQIENFETGSQKLFQDITKDIAKDIHLLKTIGKVKTLTLPPQTEKG